MNMKNKKGFSLLEILIYTGLIALTGMLLSGILISVTRISNQQNASTEVNQQLNFVMQNIQRLVRDSSSIEIPSGTATTSLKLRMKTASEDPTLIYISNNAVYLSQGSGGIASPLTNNQVTADNMAFLKISTYPGHDSVQIDLDLSYNTQNPQDVFSKSLSSAVARVSAATFDSDMIPGSTNSYDIGLSATRWQDLYLSGNLTAAGNASITNDAYVEGNLGVGTAGAPGAKLHVVGEAKITGISGDGSQRAVCVKSDGNLGTCSTVIAANGTCTCN